MSGTVIKVGNEAELNQAIASADAATSGSFDIQFTNGITEGTDIGASITFGAETLLAPPDLYAVNLHSGVALTIDGGGNTLDGANADRGFFVYAGSVAIDNLTVADAVATGGNADDSFGSAAGGGAGLGGGLFVAGTGNVDGSGNPLTTGGTVALDGVNFVSDSAVGGSGGSGGINDDAGGGGGLGGAGGSPGPVGAPTGGGGGGIGAGAVGGGGATASGGVGIVLGAAGGGAGGLGGGGGSGGGGGAGLHLGGGGGVGGQAAVPGTGRGGFGGGGGGGHQTGARGGFGGGGGGGDFNDNGGFGGFGGGGGGGGIDGGQGGFGGGVGGAPDPQFAGVASGGGGGGLGAGGGIFIQQGGVLSIEGGSFTAGEVHGGAGGASGPLPGTAGAAGAGLGSGLFLQGNQSVTLDPLSGQTLTIGDEITDQSGSGGSGGNAGAGSVVTAGDGMVRLTRANGFTGGITLTSGTLDLAAAGAAGSGGITFAASDPILQIDGTVMPTNTMTGFVTGDTIDLTSISFDATDTVSYSGTTFSIQNSLGTTLASLTLAGKPYAAADFVLSRDTGTGTDITTDIVPCFAAGTRIATERGEVAVEDLRNRDLIVTAAGKARPIRWIGRRSYTGRFAAGNRHVLPVLIRQGALADNVPRRDLFISPNHAMHLDGVLIPAIELVNDASIIQLQTIDQIEYFHVELETHDIILAEGAPAESFVDDNSRGMFHNAGEYRVLYPEAVPTPAHYCAPRVEDGEELEAVRRRLAARARGEPAGATGTPGPLEGYLDEVGRELITGWARDLAAPERPVRLRILDNGVTLGQVIADQYRPDLAAHGIGDGRHAFELIVPGGLSPLVRHVIQVQRIADGCELKRSPRVIEGAADAAVPLTLTTLPAPARTWRGRLDEVTRERIGGWAQEPDRVAPVALQILDNGVPIARVLANLYREDLERAGIGCGRHSFDIMIPGGLSPLARHVIEVRREDDGAALPGSPQSIEPATSFDASLEQAVANAVAALQADGEQDRVLSFIIAQADRLLQQRADAEGKRVERLSYRQFRRRWGPEAAEHAGAVDPGLRALVIDARVPLRDRDAGSHAALSHMWALQRLGYSVSFIAADEMARASEMLDGAGITCCGAPFYASVEDVLRRQADCFDVVYLHRASIAGRYLALARQYMPRARILYSVADLHYVRVERQAAIEARPELLAESRRLRFIECTAACSADAVITHSAYEAPLLREAVPTARVHYVPWEVPVCSASTRFAERLGLAFIGHYGHAPNQDAAHWLVETIMPRVWQTDPEIECLLVGSDMPDSIRALARPGITPLGHLADLADVYSRVRLTVAPLRYGAGVKGKVLESLAARTPCVMSPVAAEGLPFAGELAALVGDDPARMAALICRLHRDEAAHRAAVRSGLALIRKEYSAAAVNASLQAAIEDHAPPIQHRFTAGRLSGVG